MILAETGLEPQDRDPTPVNSDGEGDAVCADSEVDDVPDIVAAPLAGTDPVSEPSGMPKRRRLNDAGSAPSGILRTPAGLPVTTIAVTPGGVAIPLSSSVPASAPPACRDGVVSAVRRRGGVVGRRVRRRTGPTSTEGSLSSVAVGVGCSSHPSASPGPPSAPSLPAGQAADSQSADRTVGRLARRSSVGLPNSNAPTHVVLRGSAPSGSLRDRVLGWFRDVRARRGVSPCPPA